MSRATPLRPPHNPPALRQPTEVGEDEWRQVFAANCFVSQVFPVSGGWAVR